MKKIEKIRKLVENASKESQSLSLNPVLSIEELREFEHEFEFSFPKEYTEFVTQIGDGGLLPSKEYGINTIQSLSKYQESGYTFANLKTPFLLKRSWMPDWGDGVENDEEMDEEEVERLIEQRWEMINHDGHIVLIDDRTDNYMKWILIVTGPCKGEVWRITEYGVQRLIKSDFLKWLELYLTGGLEDYFMECKISEYPSETDLVERCRLFLKKDKIHMHPPIDLSEVQAFEKRHNITLPIEYVQLITEIGDGSKKSPWYIEKIHSLLDNDAMAYLDQPFVIQTEEDYQKIYTGEDNTRRFFNRRDSIWDFLPEAAPEEKINKIWILPQFQILHGCLVLMDHVHPSVTKQYILILNGFFKGQVWRIDNWNIKPTFDTLLDGVVPIHALTFIEAMVAGIL